MWRHLVNVIEWSDKFQCDIWLLSTQNCIGLWPPNLNSAEIFVQCTYPPGFIVLCLLVQKLSCWQTSPQTNRQILAKASNILCHYYWVKICRFTMYWDNVDGCGIVASNAAAVASNAAGVTGMQRGRWRMTPTMISWNVTLSVMSLCVAVLMIVPLTFLTR